MSKTVQQQSISLTSSDQTMKVLLIGNSGVGKSNMLTRYTEDKFNNNMLNTIGVDFKVKYLDVRGQKIKLVLWDTAGQERFRTITNGYYRGADGIIIVYDLTDRESFHNVAAWYKEMRKSVSDNVVCLLVGNKVDMDCRRVVTKEEGYQLAQQYGMPFAETSAKTSENIRDIFESLTERMVLNSPIRSNSRPILPAPLRIDPFSNPSEEEHCTCCST